MFLFFKKHAKCKHEHITKINEGFESDLQDDYYATNYGGSLRSYGYDLMKCNDCGEEIKKYNSKIAIDGIELPR